MTTPQHPEGSASAPGGGRSKRPVVIAVVVVAVLAVAGAAAWYVLLRDDAPAEVSLDAAVDDITRGSAPPTTASAAGGDGTTGDASGDGSDTDAPAGAQTWVVDISVSNADGAGFAGFRVEEELSTVGSTTAVGRTEAVTGEIVLDDTTLVSGEFTVDMTSITTDRTQRDDRVQSALETDQFPDATFVVDGPVELGVAPEDGATASTQVPGTLTVHGVEQPVTVTLDAQVVDGVLAVVGSTDITLSQFGVTAPKAPVVVSVSDDATVEWQLFLTPAG